MTDFLVIVGAKYLLALPVAAFAAHLFLLWAPERKQLALRAIISLPLAYALARLAGFFYSHPQPFVAWGGEPLVPHEIDNAFPSDHVLLGSTLAALVGLTDRYWGATILFLTGLIALARVAAGLHNFIDIAASVVLAYAAVWAAHTLLSRFSVRGKAREERPS